MMIKTELRQSYFPKLLSNLANANQYYKLFSISLIAVCALLAFALVITVNKPPILLTIASDGSPFDQGKEALAKNQIEDAVKEYLSFRYNWEPSTIKKRLTLAEAFILSNQLKPYRNALSDIEQFSQEKQALQRVYPAKFSVDLEKQVISITGDRITEIQGIKVAGNLKLVLTYESGPRTKENPWGIYVVKEMEDAI